MRRHYKAAALALAAVAIVAAGLAPATRRTVESAMRPEAPAALDVGFAQTMIEHHQQAIVMARLMLDGRPSALRAMAQSIADSQLVELGEMRGWLSLWNRPLVPAQRGMGWMLLAGRPHDAQLDAYLLDCGRSPKGMAGLASDEALERLRRLEGPDRDRLFLRLMLAHHQGALPMARFAAAEARHAAVRELATRITIEQSEEIGRLDLTLAVLDGTARAALDEHHEN